ncbi:MAG: hypothetical protein LH473_10505 [Chitinophagales bacterium]|nr:hypothetical protein [Chitinophagales bacterium]
MKSLIKVFFVSLIITVGVLTTSQKANAQVSVNFQLFYDQLSPYGQWVDYPNQGYVWLPNAGQGFSPYSTGGHWIFTQYGWTWVSDYSWGWAPFHYGRWDFDPIYGWFWVPDNQWGPAWVSWRSAPGYYGWAPLSPGISINVAFSNDYYVPNEHWVFVNDRDIDRQDINRYYVNRSSNVTIIKNSTVIVNKQEEPNRNATYIAGPDRNSVQKVTNREIKTVAIQDGTKPGQKISNNELQIYRPEIKNSNNGNGQKPAPAKVENIKDVKPAVEKNSGSQPRNQTQPRKPQPAQPKRANPDQPKNENPNQPNHSYPDQPKIKNPDEPKNENPNQPNPSNPEQPKNENPNQPNHKYPDQPRNENPNQPNIPYPNQPNNVNPDQPNNVSPNNNTQNKNQPTQTNRERRKKNQQQNQPRNNTPINNEPPPK